MRVKLIIDGRRTNMTESIANAVFLRSRAGKEEELSGRLEALVPKR